MPTSSLPVNCNTTSTSSLHPDGNTPPTSLSRSISALNGNVFSSEVKGPMTIELALSISNAAESMGPRGYDENLFLAARAVQAFAHDPVYQNPTYQAPSVEDEVEDEPQLAHDANIKIKEDDEQPVNYVNDANINIKVEDFEDEPPQLVNDINANINAKIENKEELEKPAHPQQPLTQGQIHALTDTCFVVIKVEDVGEEIDLPATLLNRSIMPYVPQNGIERVMEWRMDVARVSWERSVRKDNFVKMKEIYRMQREVAKLQMAAKRRKASMRWDNGIRLIVKPKEVLDNGIRAIAKKKSWVDSVNEKLRRKMNARYRRAYLKKCVDGEQYLEEH